MFSDNRNAAIRIQPDPSLKPNVQTDYRPTVVYGSEAGFQGRNLQPTPNPPTIYGVSNADRLKDHKLPDQTAVFEGHLWDELMDPYAADASKDVRNWVLENTHPVLILNGREMEVIEQNGMKHNFSKWKFRTPDAAHKFAEMMLPYCTVIGLL